MKLKHLMIIALIMAILSIGAVSASENISDSLAVEDNEDTLSQVDDGSLMEVIDDSQDTVGDVQDDSVLKVNEGENQANLSANSNPIHSEVLVDNGEIVYFEKNVNGMVTLLIDGNVVYQKTVKSEYDIFTLGLKNINYKPTLGTHNVVFKYNDETYQKNVYFTYSLSFSADSNVNDYFEIKYNDKQTIVAVLSYNAKGVMTFEFNGKKYSKKVDGSTVSFEIDASKLKLGKYKLKAIFVPDSNGYPKKTISADISIVPYIFQSFDVAVGSKATVDIYVPKGTKIKAVIYDNDFKTVVARSSGVSYLNIPLSNIVKNGYNLFYIKCSYPGGKYAEGLLIYGHKNYNSVKSSIVKKKNSATIKLSGYKKGSKFYVYLDGKRVNKYGHNVLKKSSFRFNLKHISSGKHKIDVYVYGKDNGKVYNRAFNIEVKADSIQLSLNKVNVKKSDKSLTLKSTLKVNDKIKKGVKVTFKFNNKKFKVKTDSKGVAKLTIGKSILKKLDVGSKVTYSASYHDKIVKKSATVKK